MAVAIATVTLIAGYAAPALAQQDLGHKVLGTLGLEAGAQQDPGVFVADRLLFYRSDRAVDRNGVSLPIDLELRAFANGVGAGVILKLEPLSTYVGAGLGFPFAHVHASTSRPEASIDRFGLGDLYVQPLRLGWRLGDHVDVVAGYAFYAPTAEFEPGGRSGIGRGYWTHEPSLGGTIWFTGRGGWNLSALASYDFNGKKRGIDITRGDTVQIQGGAGARVFRVVELGLAAYGQWQVRDDRGADLPAVLRGARDRAFGLGPEVAVRIPALRSRLSARWEHDVYARSRPVGQIFVVGLTVAVWRPRPER
ncbi:MAG TPA: transporter [Vulgatibacter sp.]